MARANATVPTDAIRIEDEVWQEAFTRREPARDNGRRLRAIEGGGPAALSERPPAPRGTSASPEPARGTGVPGRRTVRIQGRGAERHLPAPNAARRRPPRRAYERAGFRPDRLAMWAVVLGFLLVLVAILSSHG